MRETKIIVDSRERNPEILEMLERSGANILTAQLPVGDYILSDRMCVERKTGSDFENSIMDTRLFEQARRLHEGFEKAILILEEDNGERALRRNMVIGAILTLYVEMGIQVMFSSGAEETAYILNKLAEREQLGGAREPRLAGRKKAYNLYQWQLLILGSIPGVGPKLAKDLISHFKTLRNVAMADPGDLMAVDKIGRKKAEKVYRILNSEFEQGTA